MAWIYPLQRWWLLLLCGLLSIAEGELSISLPIKQREIIAFPATTYYFTVHCIDLLPPTPSLSLCRTLNAIFHGVLSAVVVVLWALVVSLAFKSVFRTQ